MDHLYKIFWSRNISILNEKLVTRTSTAQRFMFEKAVISFLRKIINNKSKIEDGREMTKGLG